MNRSWSLVLGLAAACGSSAPYTMTSAALNTGLALGASALERSSGGCYAVCTNGTVCNPKSGYCERDPVPLCEPGSACGGPLLREPLNVDQVHQQPGSTATRTLGVSPATGRAPPPPPGSAAPEPR